MPLPWAQGDTTLRCSKWFKFKTVLGAIVLIALLGACTRGPGGPPIEPGQFLNWADVVEDANLADSIYAIGLILPIDTLCSEVEAYCPEDLPEQFFSMIGTGFAAHYANTIWTNAHVALTIPYILEWISDETPAVKPVIVAVRAGTAVGGAHTYRLNMDTVRVHPKYVDPFIDSPDSFSPDLSPDLAVFLIEDASFQNVPSFLPRSLATQLRVGQPVGTLGFPGELAHPFEVGPIATFKDGTISALRPYSILETQVTPENSKLVQFNLGQTAGTSGSPVFDHEGFIVAVSFAGIETIVVDEYGYTVGIPVGNLNIGIRVDEVWDLIDLIAADAEPARAGSRGYPHATYRAYPED